MPPATGFRLSRANVGAGGVHVHSRPSPTGEQLMMQDPYAGANVEERIRLNLELAQHPKQPTRRTGRAAPAIRGEVALGSLGPEVAIRGFAVAGHRLLNTRSVSGIRASTISPAAVVRSATAPIAQAIPTRSASTPASSAPTT